MWPTSTSTGSARLRARTYLTPDRVAFLEWPEAAEPVLDRVAARVCLEHLGEDRRRITIE